MKIISHRGNLKGINKSLENNPAHILQVLEKFDVEVDVWFIKNSWFLGHDEPSYKVDYNFFRSNMWLHCKNLEAVGGLYKKNLNWFWHQNDSLTQTSKGDLWCFPGIYVPNGITVEFEFNKNLPGYIMGVCTDYPELY